MPAPTRALLGTSGLARHVRRARLRPGGRASYYMTGPDGTKSHGWWRFLRIEPPRFFEIEDGFADETGKPNTKMPEMRVGISLEPIKGGTRMTGITTFPDVEAMERVLSMGMRKA